MSLLQTMKMDKSVFSVGDLSDKSDEASYWQTPTARLEALELVRQVMYGYDPFTAGLERFFQATFNATSPAPSDPHLILRVQTSMLTQGFVRLNGHNLGCYPEVSRDTSGQGQLVDGVYRICFDSPPSCVGRTTLGYNSEGTIPIRVQ